MKTNLFCIGGDENCTKRFSPKYLKATGLGVDEMIIFKWTFSVFVCVCVCVCEDVDWILLSKDKTQWSAVLKMETSRLSVTV